MATRNNREGDRRGEEKRKREEKRNKKEKQDKVPKPIKGCGNGREKMQVRVPGTNDGLKVFVLSLIGELSGSLAAYSLLLYAAATQKSRSVRLTTGRKDWEARVMRRAGK